MTEPAISLDEANALVEQSIGVRVTPEYLKAQIASVEYKVKGTTVHCFLTMRNGFDIHGEAGCVDPANFKQEIGERYSYEKAFSEAWKLEGYHLACKRLEEQELADSLKDF